MHGWGGMHGRGCVAGGMYGRGMHAPCTVGGVHAVGACLPHMPLQQILQDTVNERTVSILLECILVYNDVKISLKVSILSN